MARCLNQQDHLRLGHAWSPCGTGVDILVTVELDMPRGLGHTCRHATGARTIQTAIIAIEVKQLGHPRFSIVGHEIFPD